MGPYGAAIVGAGASGLAAAITAARSGVRVLLLEAAEKPGRRLLATGNGRCNLSNLHISIQNYHGDSSLAAPLLEAWPGQRIRDWFQELGLLTRADGQGRLYPCSLQAAAVLRALLSACQHFGVDILCGFSVAEIRRAADGFQLTAQDGRQVQAERCLLAGGGAASPKLSAGSSYELAKSLGHTVTKLSPSLVGLRTPGRITRSLKGLRCRARAALCQGSRELAAESGEVIFGNGSVSGICVMNLSARLRGLPGGHISLRLDLAEEMTSAQLKAYLEDVREHFPARPAWELFDGLLNLREGQELAKSLGWPHERGMGALSSSELAQAVKLLKGFSLPVEGPLGWENAQCTAGGIPLNQVEIPALQSRRTPGLYLSGELLDLDGDCGGFNLHWAWATGITAGGALAGGKS